MLIGLGTSALQRYGAPAPEPHSRMEDWLANLPASGVRAVCSWERFCTFAREPERRKVGGDARVSVAGVNYEVDPDLVSAPATLYCVVKTGTYRALMTGGGFHLPVSASDFGA